MSPLEANFGALQISEYDFPPIGIEQDRFHPVISTDKKRALAFVKSPIDITSQEFFAILARDDEWQDIAVCALSRLSPKDKQEILLRICARGWLLVLQGLFTKQLKFSFTLDERLDALGNTLLHLVSYHGHDTCVRFLLEKGALVSLQNTKGQTAIYLAIEANKSMVVEMLLRVDLTTRDNESLLQLACDKKLDDMVVLLLRYGCRSVGNLHRSAEIGYAFGVERFLNSKTKIACDSEGNMPLHYAAKNGHCDVVRRLLVEMKSAINEQNNAGRTALSFAAEYGHSAVCEQLLLNGASCLIVDGFGKAPIHYAIEKRQTEVFNLLVKGGAGAQIYTKKMWSTLHFAAKIGDFEMCKTLVEYNVSPNCKTDDGITPFHLAILAGDPALIAYFLPRVDVGICYLKTIPVIELIYTYKEENRIDQCGDFEGITPETQGELAVIDTITSCLLRGSKIDERNNEGETLLHLACSKRDLKMVEFCLTQGAARNIFTNAQMTPLHIAAKSGDVTIALLLVRKGASLDAVNGSGQSVLHIAVDAMQADMVGFLLSMRSNFSLGDHEGKTPLHLFVEKERPESTCTSILEKLLTAGASVSASDRTGKSVLHCLHEKLRESIVTTLIASAGTIDLLDDEGFTPLARACQKGACIHIRLFFAAGASPEVRNSSRLKALELIPMEQNRVLLSLFQDFGYCKREFGAVKAAKNAFCQGGLLLGTRVLTTVIGAPFLATSVEACMPSTKTVASDLFRAVRDFGDGENPDEKYMRQQQLEELLLKFRTCPELLMSDLDNSPDANPMEAAYLLGDFSLMQKLWERLGADAFRERTVALVVKYPKMQRSIFDECPFYPDVCHITSKVEEGLRGQILERLLQLRKEVIEEIAESLVRSLLFQGVYPELFLIQMRKRVASKIIQVIGNTIGVEYERMKTDGLVDAAFVSVQKKILDGCSPEANPRVREAEFIGKFWARYTSHAIISCIMQFLTVKREEAEFNMDDKDVADDQKIIELDDRVAVRSVLVEKFKILTHRC